ncbi:MAG: ATP-binding protein, partial [Burkholderiales bacterium]|nr:ATP-binding protein [Opitutaceae bacterium]
MSRVQNTDRPGLTEWACVHLGRNLAEVGPAVGELSAWLRARGAVDDAWLDEVTLATTEALTNAMRHGGGGAEAFTVRLAWSRRGEEIEVVVTEPGSFTPAAHWHDLPEDPLAEGGRGGYLITQLMEAVEHSNAGGHHTLSMRRRLVVRKENAPVTTLVQADTEAALNAMTDELGNAYETIAALFSLAEGLATTPELRALAGKSLSRLLPLLGADAAWVRLAEEDGSLARLDAEGQGPAPGP